MPNRKMYLSFDSLLKTQGIVNDKDYSPVHDWMDNYLASEKHQHIDLNSNIMDEVKIIVTEKCDSTNEQMSTDCLRVAIGHLLLYVTANNFVFKNEYELMKRAFQTYTDKDYSKRYSKAP